MLILFFIKGNQIPGNTVESCIADSDLVHCHLFCVVELHLATVSFSSFLNRNSLQVVC